jgi:hypothetical protein
MGSRANRPLCSAGRGSFVRHRRPTASRNGRRYSPLTRATVARSPIACRYRLQVASAVMPPALNDEGYPSATAGRTQAQRGRSLPSGLRPPATDALNTPKSSIGASDAFPRSRVRAAPRQGLRRSIDPPATTRPAVPPLQQADPRRCLQANATMSSENPENSASEQV